MNNKDKILDKVKERVNRTIWKTKYTWSPRHLYRNASTVSIDKPVFLIGNEGAGLTLISRMLRRNPCVVFACGNHRFWAGNAEMHNCRSSSLPKKLQSPNVKLWALGEQLKKYKLTKEEVTTRRAKKFKDVISNIIKVYSKNISKARFVDKSQSYGLKIPFLANVFKDTFPLFIIVVRDPYAMSWRDACSNNIGKRWYNQFGSKMNIKKRVRLVAKHWSNLYKIILEDAYRYGRFKIVKFEDVLMSPEKIVPDIFGFCDLEFNDDYLPQPHHELPAGSGSSKKWFPLRPNINASYREQMPDWAVKTVESYCGGLAEQFDYSRP